MPHIVLIYSDDGEVIGSYAPPHDDQGGAGVVHSIVPTEPALSNAIAKAIDEVLKTEENASVELSFKVKLKH